MLSEILRFIWILTTTILAVFIWNYFRKYFDSVNDISTATWIKWIIGAFVIFGLLNLYMSSNSSYTELDDLSDFEDKFLTIALFAPMLILIVSGFKIYFTNSKHPFPLKRIAISTMIITPLYIIVSIIFGSELVRGGVIETMPNLIFYAIINAFLVLPFIFLLHHFYRADKEDETQN